MEAYRMLTCFEKSNFSFHLSMINTNLQREIKRT